MLRRPGEPLAPDIRSAAEANLGHDFSSVRIHADPAAGESALALGAHAYAFGRHVVMAPGRFQRGSEAGDRLLAHELAHVIQQGNPAGDVGDPGRVGGDSDPTERAAAHVAAGLSRADAARTPGGPARTAVVASVAPHIARLSIHNPSFPCHEVSGTVMPGSFDFFGTAVHLAIQQHYVSTIDPLAATEYLIPGSGTLGGSGRADIVDSTGGVYEIKPYGLQAEALEEAENYILSAEATCDPAVNWHLGTTYWPPVIPTIIAGSIVTSWLAGPGVILYLRRQLPVPVPVPEEKKQTKEEKDKKKEEEKDKKQPTPVPVPVPVPARSTTELIKDWARSVIASGADATAAAEQFFREHPDLPWVVLGLGTVAIIVLVADDATLAGIADDVLVPLIATLMRVAWRFA